VTLLAIIIVWSLYHFTELHHRYERVHWFESLMAKLEPQLAKTFPAENVRFTFLVFLPLVIFWISVHLIKFSTGHIGRLIVDSLVLWYCWLYQEPITLIPGTTREQTRLCFVGPLAQRFSVTLWFVIFGPMAALLYDFTRRAQQSSYAPYAKQVRKVLDWPAARLLALGYALAGHFSPAFSYWALHLFTDTHHNKQFLEDTGLLALIGNNTHELPDKHEPEHAKALVHRAEIMLLIVLAIFTLGAFIY
jgi:membrane protein required for beta-lactamase induction